MKNPAKTIWMLVALSLFTACGAGGGGGGGSGDSGSSEGSKASGDGASSSNSNLNSESIEDRLWGIPVSTTMYGQCGLIAKFSSSTKRFGIAWICQSSVSTFKYEVAYGSYSLSGDRVLLTKDNDNCSGLDTIFNDPNNSSNQEEVMARVSNGRLVVTSNSSVLSFQEIQSTSDNQFSFIATRGCFVKQNSNVFAWSNYPQASAAENVGENIQSNVSTPPVTTQETTTTPITGNGSSGGCATVTYNSAVTITFYGNLTPYSSGIKAQLPVYAVSAYTGGFSSNYTRTNVAGDSLNLYVNGSQAYAVVSLAQATVNAVVMGQNGSYYNSSGGAQICGLYIDAAVFASPQTGAGWSGTIGGGTLMMWSNGRWISNVNL